MKKSFMRVIAAVMAAGLLAGCGAKGDDVITVISREEGSGTRGAFIELFGIEQKDAEGNKVDHTTVDADITNSTSVMMTSVSGNPQAIGYISLGSLNNTVKALEIDNTAATVENIKSGSYKVSRPFNIATGANISEPAQAFIDYIMSAEGQSVIEENGYIAVLDNAPSYAEAQSQAKWWWQVPLLSPVMEKLGKHTWGHGAEIEIQQSDSSSGMNAVKDGVCDIGMASRELKDSELAAGLKPMVIAMDGIAVIVNNQNPVIGLTSQQVRAIFMGEITRWSEIDD